MWCGGVIRVVTDGWSCPYMRPISSIGDRKTGNAKPWVGPARPDWAIRLHGSFRHPIAKACLPGAAAREGDTEALDVVVSLTEQLRPLHPHFVSDSI